MPRRDSVAVIAHRGASAYAPENTLEALDLAVAMGADAIEFDLSAAAGGELLALHDPLPAPGRGAPRPAPPALEAILARYGDSTRYAIDVKDFDAAAEGRLLESVARHGVEARVEVMAFEADSLERLRALAPELALVRLYRRALAPEDVIADLERAARIGKALGRAAELVDERLTAEARKHGLGVYAYVVNDEAEMDRLVSLGVTGLITDVPDRALAFLGRRPAV